MVASVIEDGVWIGGVADVTPTFLAENTIQVVISVLENHEITNDIDNLKNIAGVEWHQVALADTPEADAATQFRAVDTIISATKQAHKNVLIHCCEGTDRSAALLVAHYMISNQWSRKQAVEHVTRARLTVDIRDGLMNQLGGLDGSIRLGLYNVD